MNKQAIIKYVEAKFNKKEHKPFRVGDTLRASVRITEGNTSRIQIFEGTVISIKGSGAGRNFTLRKLSFGVGVERTFPLNSPAVEKIALVRSGHVKRAKLYYLRDRVGRAARLDEKDTLNFKTLSPQEEPSKEDVAEPEDKKEALVGAKEK